MSSKIWFKSTTGSQTNLTNMLQPMEGSVIIPLDFFNQLASAYYNTENRYFSSTDASTAPIKTKKDVKCQTDIEYANEKTLKILVGSPSSLTQSIISSNPTEKTTVVYGKEINSRFTSDDISYVSYLLDQNKKNPLTININKQRLSNKKKQRKKPYAIKSTITKRPLIEQQKMILKVDQTSTAHIIPSSSKSSNDAENDRIRRIKANERQEKFRAFALTFNALANIDQSLNSTSYNKELEKKFLTTLLPSIQQTVSETFKTEDHHH
ncbi:unnamed protein product [Rotaria sp. Silwood1]|nr:unnamed protein product [Rotaria sp. Silwood1]CAF1422393.1 unnamed protein product [Rotaria sp. Silwood1]CAF3563730.1 unnamed protein product [Rotaria sp. Silwood1]CAF3628785.1 unnamed protein product [Rotaria sp. Silwood1]CAF4892458.1 unnamed protein product [Rotaria sp. Silwood1]